MSGIASHLIYDDQYKTGTWHKICYVVGKRRNQSYNSYNYRGELKTVEDFAKAARHIERIRQITGVRIIDWIKLDIFGRESQ